MGWIQKVKAQMTKHMKQNVWRITVMAAGVTAYALLAYGLFAQSAYAEVMELIL